MKVAIHLVTNPNYVQDINKAIAIKTELEEKHIDFVEARYVWNDNNPEDYHRMIDTLLSQKELEHIIVSVGDHALEFSNRTQLHPLLDINIRKIHADSPTPDTGISETPDADNTADERLDMPVIPTPRPHEVRIINLGDIVTPNVSLTLAAFGALINSKLGTNHDVSLTPALIDGIMKSTYAMIEDFKYGRRQYKPFEKQDFIAEMITAFRNIARVEISSEEFLNAWNAMNPSYATFKAMLDHVVEFNSQRLQEVVMISFTNQIDMEKLISELDANQRPYKLDASGNLVEIEGIRLYTSCGLHATKAGLMRKAITDIKSTHNQPGLFKRPHYPVARKQINLIYVSGSNAISDPFLHAIQEQTNQSLYRESSEAYYKIETRIWDRKAPGKTCLESFADALSVKYETLRSILAADVSYHGYY